MHEALKRPEKPREIYRADGDMLLCGIGLLSVATKTLPLGVSYAVWTGLGTLFNVLFGIIVF